MIGIFCRLGSCRAGSVCFQQVTRSGPSGLSSLHESSSAAIFTAGA